LEVFDFLGIFKICLIIQTIGFLVCMENQTDTDYTETIGLAGNEVSPPAGF
jgi:TM2 domain-containing membrane protein YozV